MQSVRRAEIVVIRNGVDAGAYRTAAIVRCPRCRHSDTATVVTVVSREPAEVLEQSGRGGNRQRRIQRTFYRRRHAGQRSSYGPSDATRGDSAWVSVSFTGLEARPCPRQQTISGDAALNEALSNVGWNPWRGSAWTRRRGGGNPEASPGRRSRTARAAGRCQAWCRISIACSRSGSGPLGKGS